MFDWDDFRFFQAVKKAGTLKGAASRLGADQATVGRRLYALEARLGTKLFEKRSNGYFLTTGGERVSAAVDRIEAEFDSIGRRIAGDQGRLEGTIRIAAPGALANHLLIPALKDFLLRYPGITLQFLTGPEVVNLSKREADLAVRFVRPNQKNLQVRKIGKFSVGLYAAKRLLAGRKKPVLPEDMAAIPFVGLETEAMSELETDLLAPLASQLRPALKTHAWSSVYSAVAAGVGAGVLPEFIAKRDATLVPLEVVEPRASAIWLVMHPDLKGNSRVRALVDEIARIEF